MEKRTGQDRIERMEKLLKNWQKLERKAIEDTTELIEEVKNPLLRMVMSIIRHDSLIHHQVQQFLIDSVTKEDVPVTREDLVEVWDRIEQHDRLEKKTIEAATVLRNEAWSPVHKYLLTYLLEDEKKHESLLAQLSDIKGGMDRASGG